MSREKIVRMANQIASFFETAADGDAAAGVADHINKFWEPRMRAQLFQVIDAGDTGLNPLVLEAAPAIRKPKQAGLQADA